MGNRLTDPFVGKEGVFQVVAEIGVGEGKIAELVVILPEQVVLRLPGVLERGQSHPVDPIRPEFQEHGRRIGDDPQDVAVDVRPPLEIVGIRDKDDLLTGHPLLEAVRPRADGIPPEGRGGDLLSGKQVLRKDADRPAHQGRGERLVIGHPEGVSVQDLGLLHFEEVARVGRGRFGIDRHLVRVEHILGGKGPTVVPADVFAQIGR